MNLPLSPQVGVVNHRILTEVPLPRSVTRVKETAMVRLCFVCLGNICRSPTAEGIMVHLIEKRGLSGSVQVESAGTGAWHVGERADPRSQETAIKRGVPLPSRARQFTAVDFTRFDYVLAMDRSNFEALRDLDEGAAEKRLYMFRNFDPTVSGTPDVPDPYYGGPNGFDDVFELCLRACEGLLEHVLTNHEL